MIVNLPSSNTSEISEKSSLLSSIISTTHNFFSILQSCFLNIVAIGNEPYILTYRPTSCGLC